MSRIITLGEIPVKEEKNGVSKELTPHEIQEAMKSMDSLTRSKYIEFLISKIEYERDEIIKATEKFNETAVSLVIAKGALLDPAIVLQAFENVIDIMKSDFTGLNEETIHEAKKMRKELLKDLSLAYYKDFK